MSYQEIYDALFAERDRLRARVAELEEQIECLTAKLDDRQEALADIADGVESPFYDPEAIGCGLEDRSITDRYEAAEYGWTCCQEAYRSWIEGLTAELLPSGDDGVSE